METNKLKIMRQSGQVLSKVKSELAKKIIPGAIPLELDQLADKIIKEAGATASFRSVSDYRNATCININAGMVHGIPGRTPLKAGDVVTVDCGVYFQGFHTDSAFSVQIPPHDKETTKFLSAGKQALKSAISKVKPGRSIYDISLAMQQIIEKGGYSVSTELTGHGIGEKLHQLPNISCFAKEEDKQEILKKDQTLAIEIMYAKGDSRLEQEKDGWTLSTIDNSITGMFEETVYITQTGYLILTN